MPLGIEQDNIAPQLIQSSGQALVQGIRQIGQQISGHLTELQTKRDLGSMAQDIQGLNVQSNEFPIQLAQLTARHPLAAQDERAKMILAPLGVAHAQWRAEESDARAFNRAMALQTRRAQDAKSTFTFEQDYKRTHPQYIPGVGVTTLEDPNDPTGNPNVLLPAAPRSTAMPYASTPNGVMDRRTGLDPQGNPLPKPGAKPMSQYQRAQLRRSERNDKLSAIHKEIDQFDSDITSGERAYKEAFAREEKATTAEEKMQHQLDKTKIGTDTDALKAEKSKRLFLLQKLREEEAQDAAVPPDEAAAPATGDLPVGPGGAAPGDPSVLPSTTEIRVGKDGKRYEVDLASKKVLRQVP